jgi:hypothetical protein
VLIPLRIEPDQFKSGKGKRPCLRNAEDNLSLSPVAIVNRQNNPARHVRVRRVNANLNAGRVVNAPRKGAAIKRRKVVAQVDSPFIVGIRYACFSDAPMREQYFRTVQTRQKSPPFGR